MRQVVKYTSITFYAAPTDRLRAVFFRFQPIPQKGKIRQQTHTRNIVIPNIHSRVQNARCNISEHVRASGSEPR